MTFKKGQIPWNKGLTKETVKGRQLWGNAKNVVSKFVE